MDDSIRFNHYLCVYRQKKNAFVCVYRRLSGAEWVGGRVIILILFVYHRNDNNNDDVDHLFIVY